MITILLATLGVSAVFAAAIAPVAGITGASAARAEKAMESDLTDIQEGGAPGVSTMYDSEGNVLANFFSQRRHEVPPEEISQAMKDAIVAIEDNRFYEHEGVDFQGYLRALATNIAAGGVQQGASTIHQQYAKNWALLVDADTDEERREAIEQTIARKLREIRVAADLDDRLSKEDILAGYLNLVPFGNHAYGIESAARTYFGISAAELSVPQAAMLAGMVQSSEYLNPYTNPDGATDRRNTVLQAMVDHGYLDQEAADGFKNEPLGVLETPETLANGCIAAGDAGFFCDYALKYLDERGITTDELVAGKYDIHTTLDPGVQHEARRAVSSYTDPQANGVAEVMNVIEPSKDSRRILAMTSSRNYGLNQEAGETILPQPYSLVGHGAGSVFKVFAAAAAIEDGMGIEQYMSVPSRYEAEGLGHGGAPNCPANRYCVENFGEFADSMTLRDALAHSPNTPFVQLMERVGVPAVVDLSVNLGLRSYAEEGTHDGERSIAQFQKDANLGSYVLGSTPVNALELSNVGASLASGGTWCEPNPIDAVYDRNGQEVYLERTPCENVMDSNAADALSQAMTEDGKSGTAANARNAEGFPGTMAAKTGTTNENYSAAFLAFNSGIAAAPYIFNDSTTTMSLCTSPVRQCSNGNLFGGTEPARSFYNMANNLPPALNGGVSEDYDPAFNEGLDAAKLNEVRGLRESVARDRLAEAGLEVRTERVAGNGMPAGRVVSADFAGPANSVVILRISDGSSRSNPPTRRQSSPGAPTENNTGGGGSQPPALEFNLEQEIENATEELRNLFNF